MKGCTHYATKVIKASSGGMMVRPADNGGIAMSPKMKRRYDAGENDRMKMYGDEPDDRPRGRVVAPEGVPMLRALRQHKGTKA